MRRLRIHVRLRLFAILVGVLLFVGCGGTARIVERGLSDESPVPIDVLDESETPEEPIVLATVNGEPITLTEYNERLKRLSKFERARYRLEQGHKDFLQALVQRKLMMQVARNVGVDRDVEVQRRIAKLVRDVTEQVLIEAVVQKEVFDKIVISDEEAKAYYNEHADEFTTQARVRLRHILVRTEEEAQEVLKALKEGADFETLVKEKSIDHSTSDKGGDLGTWTRGSMPPEFEQASDALEVGDPGQIIKSDIGFHIVQVVEKQPVSVKEFYEVRDEIKQKLLTQRKRERYDEWIRSLEESAKIDVDESFFEQ